MRVAALLAVYVRTFLSWTRAVSLFSGENVIIVRLISPRYDSYSIDICGMEFFQVYDPTVYKFIVLSDFPRISRFFGILIGYVDLGDHVCLRCSIARECLHSSGAAACVITYI